jgi:hypothetical protein
VHGRSTLASRSVEMDTNFVYDQTVWCIIFSDGDSFCLLAKDAETARALAVHWTGKEVRLVTERN